MDNFIIWGATGQAIVLEELLIRQNFKIIAFFDNNHNLESPFKNIPVYYGNEGFEGWLKMNNSIHEINYLVAIGGSKGKEREIIFEYLKSYGLNPRTVVHNTAFVAYNAILGAGSQILAQSSICAKVILGKSVIVNTAASVDHESIIGDFVHIAPGARLCGCVKVGNYSFIGANATILPHLTIGVNSIIGAGAIVTKDIPDNVIFYGNRNGEIKSKSREK